MEALGTLVEITKLSDVALLMIYEEVLLSEEPHGHAPCLLSSK